MCCAIQNINKPQRPEDQIKEAAQLVAAQKNIMNQKTSERCVTYTYYYYIMK